MASEFNAFEMAQRQFDAVADKLQLDDGIRDLLRWPQREYHFTIPVKIDRELYPELDAALGIQHTAKSEPVRDALGRVVSKSEAEETGLPGITI